MKTTKEILDKYVRNDMYKGLKWFSEEEIRKAINECYSYGHRDDLEPIEPEDDDNLICVSELLNKLFGVLK